MLVLSRRSHEGISLPDIDVVFRILEVKVKVVRLGIKAPSTVTILREELKVDPAMKVEPAAVPRSRAAAYVLRNQLNKLSLGLHLRRRQLQAGQEEKAAATLNGVVELLEKMDLDWLASQLAPVPAPYRTLVVDDDANERELLVDLLNLNGCKCETSVDGQEMLDYLETHDRPDVVLLDMCMLCCSGYEAIGRIRRNPRYTGLKVFAISEPSPADFGVPIGPDGVDGWFPKPLKLQSLLEAIQNGPSRS